MVGVPHSTGCALCRERRIKCDEAVPQCTQCRKYGRPCPGYRRTFRFQDEGPALQRRHQSQSPRHVVRESPAGAVAEAAEAVCGNALAMLQQQQQQQQQQSHRPIDTADSNMETDTTLFTMFIRSAFPTLSVSLLSRIPGSFSLSSSDSDSLAHLVHSFTTTHAAAHPYLSPTISSLASIYLHLSSSRSPPSSSWTTHLLTSRETYTSALLAVAHALRSPPNPTPNPDTDTDTDTTPLLATIMLLTIYELFARTSRDAWLVHIDGVRRLLRARGPATSTSTPTPTATLSRTCYLAFRGLLVAAALYEGQACLLDADGWGALAWEPEPEPEPDSALIRLCEEVRAEMVKCPRYLAEANGQIPPEGPGWHSEQGGVGLAARICETRARLVRLIPELERLIQDQAARAAAETATTMRVSEGGAAELLRQGAEGVVVALGDVLYVLERRGRARAGSGMRAGERSRGFALPFRVVSEFHYGVSSVSSETPRVDWLDRVAASMGMLGLRIIPHEG